MTTLASSKTAAQTGKVKQLASYRPAKGTESIPVMVVLGSPKRNCAGQGICRVDGGLMTVGESHYRPCQTATAIADPVIDAQLRLHFVKASLCPQALRKHFGAPAFEVIEPGPVHIPQWGLGGLYVKPGSYTTSESERYYTVCFELDGYKAFAEVQANWQRDD